MVRRALTLTLVFLAVVAAQITVSSAQVGSGFETAIPIEPGNYTDRLLLLDRTTFYRLPNVQAGKRINVLANFTDGSGLVAVSIYSHTQASLSEISKIVSEGDKISVSWVVSHREGGTPFFVRFSMVSPRPPSFEMAYSFEVKTDDLSDTAGTDAGDDLASAVDVGVIEPGKMMMVKGHLTVKGEGNDFADVYKFAVSPIPTGKNLRIALSIKTSEFLQVTTTLMNVNGTELVAPTLGTNIIKEVEPEFSPGPYFVRLSNREGSVGGSYEVSVELSTIARPNATSVFTIRNPLVVDFNSLGFTVATMAIVAVILVAFVAGVLRRRKIYRVE